MNIYEEVKDSKTIGISGHIRPDGDCVGSCMGLYLYLKKVCPAAAIQVMIERPADVFSCIRGIEEISSDFKPITEKFDVYIALDSEKSRIGEAEKFFDQAEKRIKSRLVLEAVVKSENIAASDEDYEEELKTMAEAYQMEVEKVKELLPEKSVAQIKEDIAVRKAAEFVVENAKEK